MAAKKKKRIVKSSRSSRKSSSQEAIQESFPTASSSSYVNLLYGAFSVFIIFVLIFSAIKFFLPRPEQHGEITKEAANTSKAEEIITPTVTPEQPEQTATVTPGNTYTVQEGDNLWSISEKVYKSGYNWVSIAKANNITDPGVVFKGTKLVFPSVTPIVIKTTPSQNSNETPHMQTGKITGTTYVIQKGDDLWDVAERAYNDGYKWVDIAKANGLSDPNLIHVGNTLQIPR